MGIARASGGHAYGAKGLDNHGPLWTLRSLARVKMDVVQEAELHKDYSSSTQKALIPLIYCHGLSSNRTMHSGTCRDLASHGYLVFVLDHQDGTSSYTVSKDGNKEFYYENRHKLYDSEVRKSQTKIRTKEVISLIDDLFENNGATLLRKLFMGPQINLDLDRLIISGHSFGGMTAIQVAKEDPRVKLCATLDPWVFAYH